jgi:hypothetical protein
LQRDDAEYAEIWAMETVAEMLISEDYARQV